MERLLRFCFSILALFNIFLSGTAFANNLTITGAGATLFIAGCAMEPQMFGMPQNQFNQLTPKQQSEVIASYNRQQEMKTKNEPINNAFCAKQ